jgi:hypothetical protein
MNSKEILEKYGESAPQYELLNVHKSSLDGMWEECSELTLPYIFPADDLDETQRLPTPFNSLGPSAVNALSSKLLLALVPPTGPFFRLLPDEKKLEGLEEEQLDQLDKELSDLEQKVVERITMQGLRVPLFEAMKLLIVTGNALLYKTKNKGLKVFSPHQYVVKRDFVGNVTELIIKETMSYVSLPEKVQKQLEAEESLQGEGEEKDVNLKPCDVYTRATKTGPNTFTTWQEIKGTILDGSTKDYKEENLPYIALRWSTINNEDYGRGLVEQYIGDLRSLEGLTQTIVEGSGIAAQFIFGLRPGSSLQIEDLNNAQNGEFVLGDLEREVSVLQVNKGPDLAVPMQMIKEIEARLSRAFLMVNGNIRDSERTTAVEVRATVSELESTLGGVYTVLATELQKPLITLLLNEMAPDALEVTDVSITTGISAISRERDFQNLNTMVQAITQFGPEAMSKYLKMGSYFESIASALGMDATKIVKSDQEVQAQEQAAMEQQQQMVQQQQEQEQGNAMALEAQKQQPQG